MTVLLKAFSATRKGFPLPAFMTDPGAERLTFEKCVYESYLAFRGVGGKKPDEGRGRWAQMNFDPAADPLSLSHLANRFHGGSTSRAHFWLSFIEEAAADLAGDEETIHEMVSEEGRPEALAELAARRDLSRDHARFLRLGRDYWRLLDRHEVTLFTYMDVFSPKALGPGPNTCDPRMLDGLFQSVTVPAEDFEIVYAALRADADLFVTEDKRLRKCSFSLGLHLPLSPGDFCTAAAYEGRVVAWREEHSVADI